VCAIAGGKERELATRTLALLATLGGAGVTIGGGVFVAVSLSRAGVRPWALSVDPLPRSIMTVAGTGGMIALAIATIWLVYRFQDRISVAAALAGTIGAVGGILGSLGSYPLLFLFPAGTAVLVWDLARARVLNGWLAAAHVASAVGFVVPIGAMLGNTPIGVAMVLALAYPITWLAVGLSLLRGVPVDQSGAPAV
jgi:hypothetical protein